MINDMIKQLTLIKKNMDEKIANRNQVDAEIKFLYQKMKEDFDCNSLEEAQGLLEQMMEESKVNQEKIKADYTRILNEAKQKGLI